MTEYAADTDGAVVCVDCLHGACVTGGRWCEAEHCRCECRNRLIADDADRARDMDDRPDDKLAIIANELETERRGNLRDLTAERFGTGRRP